MYRKYRSKQTVLPKAGKIQQTVAAEDKLADEYDDEYSTEENEVTKKGFFSSFIDFSRRLDHSKDMQRSFFFGGILTMCAISLGQLLAKLI